MRCSAEGDDYHDAVVQVLFGIFNSAAFLFVAVVVGDCVGAEEREQHTLAVFLYFCIHFCTTATIVGSGCL